MLGKKLTLHKIVWRVFLFYFYEGNGNGDGEMVKVNLGFPVAQQTHSFHSFHSFHNFLQFTQSSRFLSFSPFLLHMIFLIVLSPFSLPLSHYNFNHNSILIPPSKSKVLMIYVTFHFNPSFQEKAQIGWRLPHPFIL